MRCPSCLRDNDQAAAYCIHCGKQLPLVDRISATHAEVQGLKQEIVELRTRLARLESGSAAVPAAVPVRAIPEAPRAVPAVPEPAMASSALSTAPAVTSRPVVQVVKEPAPARVETWTPPPPPSTPPKPAKPREWELILGGNWLARVGALALIIGMGFFVKFAFENNWLTPLARIVLGFVVGLGLVAGGLFWRKKYPVFAQAVSGGGVAIMYLSCFAALLVFDLFGAVPTVLLVLAVSVGSALLALKHDSMALAILGIAGAFTFPVMLGISVPAADVRQYSVLFLIYVLLVDAGILALSTYRNWRWFTFISMAGSYYFFGAWYGFAERNVSMAAAVAGLTLIFLMFVGSTVLHHLIWKRQSHGGDYALMSINAAAYLLIGFGVMWEAMRPWLGAFSLLVAMFYLGLAAVAGRRGSENRLLSTFAVGIAVVVVAIAVPVQFGDSAWATIAWAVQGAVLTWLYLRLKSPQFMVYGFAAFGLAAGRLLLFDAGNYGSRLVFNESTLAFTVSAAFMVLASYLVWRAKEAGWKAIHGALLASADILLLIAVGLVLGRYSDILRPTVGQSQSLLIMLPIASFLILHPLFKKRDLTVADAVTAAISGIAVAIFAALLWDHLRAWMGGLFLVLSALFALVSLGVSKTYRDSFGGVLHYYTALSWCFVLVSAAVPVQFTNHVWTTLGWMVEAAVLAALSLKTRSPLFRVYTDVAVALVTASVPFVFGDTAWTSILWSVELVALVWLGFVPGLQDMRSFGYVTFIFLAGHLVFFRTMDVSDYRPLANGRFLVFVFGIAAAYVSAFLLNRYRRLLSDWQVPYSTLITGANILTLWLLSFEVWDYFGTRQAGLSVRSAQLLSLTAVWVVYGVVLLVLGITRRWRSIRVAGLLLLALGVVKVFVYDVFALQQVYRIAAFVGLGVLLLVSGYLYQRYSHAIKGFILNN